MALTVKFEKITETAETPKKATKGSVAYDLVAVDCYYDSYHRFHEYGTGLKLALPEGYEAQIRPRSSISKTSFILCNSLGTIDTDYRGELKVRFKEIDDREVFYEPGDRIAQLIIKKVPEVNFTQVISLDKTDRGEGGFGSTGK